MASELNEQLLIRSMVRALSQHPGEWLTFGRLSQLVAIADCDADIVGAIAEYRKDLFAVTNDRKMKLRPNVTEEVALRGGEHWQIPALPEKNQPVRPSSHVGRTSSGQDLGCYCKAPYTEILADLRNGSVSDDALVFSCCWQTICRVRGLHFNAIEPEVWAEICRRRGYIQSRENPRGF